MDFMGKSFPLEDPDTFEQYLGALRIGEGPHRAAKRIGLTAAKVRNWLKSHPDESDLVAEAESEAAEAVEDRLYESALAGEPWAIQTWLRNRAPERWKAEAKNGALNVGTVNILQGIDPSELSRSMKELASEAGNGAIDVTSSVADSETIEF